MRYLMHSEQWVPYPKEMVFRFFANPENLPRLMPAWQKTRIEEAQIVPPATFPEGAGRMPSVIAGDGTRVTISMRPFPFSPIRLPWEALIQEFQWNVQFADVQVRGPFSYWHHRHTITTDSRAVRSTSSEEGTLIRDDLEYELPFGLLGKLAQRSVVRYVLRYTFNYRHKRTRELLALMAAAEAVRR